MGEKRTWSVPVFTYATTAIEFLTDIDPIADPEGFKAAFDAVGFDFPRVNMSNDFDMEGEWEISCRKDGTPDVWTPEE